MNTPQEIAELIHALAKNKGMSVHKILQECNAGRGLIDRLKLGQEPSAMKLALVAEYLGVSVDYLLGIETKQ